MTLHEYWVILRRSWLLVVATTLVGILAALGLSMLVTPLYQAQSQLFVSVQAGNENDTFNGGYYVQQRMDSYVEIVDTPGVLDPVVTQLQLDGSPSVSAQNPTNTVLINVVATDTDPEVAAAVANATAVSMAKEIVRLETTPAGTKPVSAEQVRPAEVPGAPISPRTQLNLVLGALLGLMVGVGIAILRATLDTTIKSVDDLVDATRATVLGSVSFDPDAAKHPLVTLWGSPRAEAYRGIRTNLQYVDVDNPPRSVVITSSVPVEGKSTTAANLAIALAQSGSTVLLVEADLRRPRVADYLGVDGSIGLTDVLIGRALIDDAIIPWQRGLMDFLPSGAIPPNPSELLGSKQLEDLLTELGTRYSIVILDAPPLLPVTDAAILTAIADGAILVARYGETHRDQAELAADALAQVNGRLFGTVLNFVPQKRRARGYNYGYGYGYGYDEAAKDAGQGNGSEPARNGRRVLTHDDIGAPGTQSPGGKPKRARGERRTRRRWLIGFAGVAVVLLGVAAWFGLSARSTFGALTQSRAELLAGRDSLAASDLAAAEVSFSAATANARTAAEEVNGPLWSVAAAIPVLGATPAAVQAVATSLDEALSAMAPAVGLLGDFDPGSSVASDSLIDMAVLKSATEPLESARLGIAAASETLNTAPSRADGDRVLGQVDDAATELARQLDELDGTLDGAIEAAQIAGPLLGADGPKRYFVAILNPNEARGTGGFLGTYLIIGADAGKITVEQIGSNSDLPTVPSTPAELGAQFISRYEPGPRLVPNLNISPHYPAAGLLWQKSWEVKTGEVLDGAISADVVALGDLLTATDQQVTLPDGGSMTGAELTDFAIQGIYEKFPGGEDVPARKVYQEAVTRDAFDLVTSSTNRSAMATAIGAALTERRIQIWSADPTLQERVLQAGIGGTLAVPEGHHVAAVAINSSASKLDAFLERSLVYEVGRCPDPVTGRVNSVLRVGLTSAIPEGVTLPDYMISGAKRGPDGPINSTLAQLYLPMGAEVLEVLVDGRSASYLPFSEQDRAAVLLEVRLPPRNERVVTVEFSEPANDGPGTAPAQPLVGAQATTIIDRPCAGVPVPVQDAGVDLAAA